MLGAGRFSDFNMLLRAKATIPAAVTKTILLVCCFVMAGCGTPSLTYKPSLLHFSTPETSGALGAGLAEIQLAVKTPEYNFGPTQNSKLAIDESETMRLSGWLGIFTNTDFHLRSDRMFGIKTQLIGGSRLSAEQGLKLALAVETGSVINHRNNLFYAESTSPAAVEVADFSVNIGYRYNRTVLAYLNSFVSINDVHGEVVSNRVTVNRVNESSRSRGVLAGFSLLHNKGTILTLEAGVAETRWPGAGIEMSYPVGASIGYAW